MVNRPRVQKIFTKPSKTQQSFKDECDLGKTIRKFARSADGRLSLAKAYGFAEGLVFDDHSSVPSLQSAYDIVSQANSSFEALPAILRKRFDNDPIRFVEFVNDPKNLDACRELGLCNSVPQDAVAPQGAVGTPGVPKA